MFQPSQYQLLDFGQGRKLERFGPHVLDRPCPAADEAARSDTAAWTRAGARYERTDQDRGRWLPAGALPLRWTITRGAMTFELKVNQFGHLGLFVEQAANWDWIARRLRRSQRPLEVLNLFAYTGASTLAAAAAGGRVVHVDASRNIVAWARRNAARCDLAAAPIRWIVEDAVKFVRRELRRGNRYDAVILDPPSYGHGPKGQPWKLDEHLPPLLRACAELTAGRRAFMLLSCHTPGYGPAELSRCLGDAISGPRRADMAAQPLTVEAVDGRKLLCGAAARWSA